MAKNAPFHIKLPVKNFHGLAKGGASHRGPPKYATVHNVSPSFNSHDRYFSRPYLGNSRA